MNSVTNNPALDPETCRRARLSRDPRFDGEFYLGVTTTGIYCRPVCPARLPAEKNVRYFRHAAQAAEAGFRPCLRCRPETAPNSPAWDGTATTVNRALQLIRGGALNDGGSIPDLADRLGVGERYLRKLFQRELGLSPHAVAHNQRLLMARQLIAETDMPLVDVAHAAGFGSVRRFNGAIRDAYGVPASAMRRRKSSASNSRRDHVHLELRYRPPYDWEGIIDYFRRHAVDGVETVSDSRYTRQIPLGAETAQLSLRPLAGRDALELTLTLPKTTNLMPIVASVRRMFDLDANPTVIAEALSSDPVLERLISANPGVRSPGCWNAAESAIRAIVGQQVSTAAARNICSRFAAACADAKDGAVFPTPTQVAALDDSHFPMPSRRRDTLRVLGTAGISQDRFDTEDLAALPGIGPWTVAMVAMRGFGNPDVFPTSDLGLVKAWEALGGNRKELADAQENWRPWRSYAANLLWRSPK